MNETLYLSYLSIGPKFVGFSLADSTYEEKLTQTGSSISESDRPAMERSFVFEISYPSILDFNSSSSVVCKFDQVFDDEETSASNFSLIALALTINDPDSKFLEEVICAQQSKSSGCFSSASCNISSCLAGLKKGSSPLTNRLHCVESACIQYEVS